MSLFPALRQESTSHFMLKLLAMDDAGFKNVYYKEVDQASLSHPRMAGAEVLACFQKL